MYKTVSIMLFFILLKVFAGCDSSYNENEIKETQLRLGKHEFTKFKGWHIYPRDDDYTSFFYLYEHSDSSKYLYNNSGQVISRSKYYQVGFGITNNLDSLYHLSGKETVTFDEGVLMISKITNEEKDKVRSKISNVVSLYNKLEIPEIIGFPWTKGILFKLDQSTELMYFDESKTSKSPPLDNGYYKLSELWYYRKMK